MKFHKILVFLLLASLSILTSCSKKQTFHRARAVEPKAKDIDLHSLKKDRDNNLYYHHRSSTFRFQTKDSSMTFPSPLSGECHISMSCISQDNGKLVITTEKSNHETDSESPPPISIRKGFNEINFKLNTQKGQLIILKNPDGTDILFSTPLVYKSLPKQERINVFLISVDTLSSLHMSLYGYHRKTTPHIEQFAQDSVVFSNAFSNSSWTVTSHMSLFTSLHEHEHQVEERAEYEIQNQKLIRTRPPTIYPLSYNIPYFPENISKEFVAISYNGGVKVDSLFGFYRGFDLYWSNNDLYDEKASAVMFEETKNKLMDSEFPKAFYFLHTYHVHAPHNAPLEFLDQIPRETKITEFDFNTDLGGNTCIFKPTGEDYAEDIKALYDAEILSFDHYFGEFIRFLKDQGLYHNSMIILLSDHGEEFFEHQRWAHGSDLYNEQIRVPVLIKLPEQKHKGKTIKEYISLQDILPTIMDYYGISYGKNIRGQSLLPLIRKNKSLGRPIVSSNYKFKSFELLPGKIAVIQDHYKIIFNKRHFPETFKYFKYPPPSIISTVELYDLETDPKEQNNLFSNNIPQKDKLFAFLKEIMKEMDDTKRRTGRKENISEEMMERLRTLGYVDK
ncbi:MAG: sulfatase-like hydrolase/transferase [Candidatus Aminicenantes bacterium]|nr:sulfatase-like hydrolase/transferase [Candidatus Aminicenantes bacterium]